MIIADEGADDTPKTTEARLETQGESSQQPPPQYTYDPSTDPFRSPNTANMDPQPAGRRFVEAFLVAIVVWFLLGVFTSSVWDIAHTGHRHGGYTSVEQGDGCSTGAQWRSSGVRANGANGSYAYPKSVATAFSLPVSSEVLYFVAHGSQLSGSLDVVDDGYEEGVVQVDVTVFYYDDSALDRASVCKLSREGGQNGVGFFTPSRWEFPSGREQIFMKVVAHFPAVHGEGVLRIPAFDTNLPLFSQQLGALEGSVYFDSLALRSSNARIAAQSVKAKSARIETSNSPIEGVYKTDRYLSLVTSNARIQAQVGLYNDDGVRATELVMTTSNSNIESEISMHSTASSHTGGSFKSTLTTKNGRIDVSHPDAPVDALLDFTASSTNSGVTVQLHPAYEGGFELGTSNARAVVDVGGKVPDPKRRGRERRVWQEGGQRGAVRGEVYWEEERRGAGRVVVRSSNSPVMLRL